MAKQAKDDSDWIKIDWSKVVRSGKVFVYQEALKERLKFLISQMRSNVRQVEDKYDQEHSREILTPFHTSSQEKAQMHRQDTYSVMC